MKKLPEKLNDKSGFIALSSVIIIMFIITLMITSITFQTINEATTTLDYAEYVQAKNDADTCFSYVLNQIFVDQAYESNGVQNISTHNRTIDCEIVVTYDPILFTSDIEVTTSSLSSYQSSVSAILNTETVFEFEFFNNKNF